LTEVFGERARQNEKWGEQNHENLIDGTPGDGGANGRRYYKGLERQIKATLDEGPADWTLILMEEVYKAVSEESDERIREELVQVAAVAVQWIEAIDRRKAKTA
jgi:hypothetical protein